MCGIIGYVGDKNTVQVVFDGLKKLEYRGYDSAGIAIQHGGEIHLEKAQGKLANLEGELHRLPQDARIGFGHTRWATHGMPTKINAHPHISRGLALIHNGIIENHKELKEKLAENGVRFSSDTDSEVVAHLLDKELETTSNVKAAILKVIGQLRGAYALGILVKADPESLYVVKQGSPLVLGIGQGENFFASDATALTGLAQQAVFLNDGECARITVDKVECWDFAGKAIDVKGVALNWNVALAEKQGYRHFMLKEIHEQPSVIANTITRFVNHADLTFNHAELGMTGLNLDQIERIHIVACGTAYLAGVLGRYFIEPMADIPVNVELASEFRYRSPYLTKKDLVIAISQSGETADTLASIKHAKAKGCQTFSVCNVRFSSIPRECTSSLYMEAGPEIGVASTKAFTSQVLCLYTWGLALAQRKGRVANEELETIFQELRTLPVQIDRAVGEEEKIQELANRYYEFPNFLYVGRGPSFPIALEGALKLKEISYIHAEGYAAGELKHGPIALVDRHMPVVGIAPKDDCYEKSISNIEEICAREGMVIGIGAADDKNFREICKDYIACPQVTNPAFQAILSSVPIQLLAYYIAVKRGTDVDQPRNLAKSVTVE